MKKRLLSAGLLLGSLLIAILLVGALIAISLGGIGISKVSADGAVFFGIFCKDIQNTMTVVAATPDLKVYSDPACVDEIDAIAWGEVARGRSYVRTVYIMNTGSRDFTKVDCSSGLDPALGTVSVLSSWESLPQGAIRRVDMTMTVLPGAPLGPEVFTLEFSCIYPD